MIKGETLTLAQILWRIISKMSKTWKFSDAQAPHTKQYSICIQPTNDLLYAFNESRWYIALNKHRELVMVTTL